MTRTARPWVNAGLSLEAYDALAAGLPPSRLWSLLLEIAEARAASRRPADLVEQWDRDRFVQPALVDQRSLVEVDRHLLAAAAAFESIELSPVAPLGVSSVMGHASQNKVLSALRGTEVVSDPTNVMALECARRLRRYAATVVRLATSHRCVRAQEIPKRPGHTANFRIFCLVSAGLERQNHAFAVEAVVEHITVMLHGLDALERQGFAFPDRRVTVMATEERAALGDRIIAMLGPSRAPVLQRRRAVSGGGAVERRHRDAINRRRRVRLGGAAHLQPQSRLRRERDGLAARAAAVSTTGKASVNLDGKVAVVTGATRGVGRGVARELARVLHRHVA
jgi:hypothetical protein